LLERNPIIADYIDYDRLIQISDTAIASLLYKQPSLFKYFKYSLKTMNPYTVLKVISKYPEYMEYANDNIFYDGMLFNLLGYQPQFYEKFKDRIQKDKENNNVLVSLGKEHPELIKNMFKDDKLTPSQIQDALEWKWIKPEDFTQEQFIKLSNEYNNGMALFFLLKDHPELLKYHTDWHFELLNDRRKEELMKRYEKLIDIDHNYKYLQDIIDKHLLY
jgi:hypothetical protein